MSVEHTVCAYESIQYARTRAMVPCDASLSNAYQPTVGAYQLLKLSSVAAYSSSVPERRFRATLRSQGPRATPQTSPRAPRIYFGHARSPAGISISLRAFIGRA
eukprot:2140782-Rhodomonas_salina.7